ncbi:prepilin-type N-terminal cleavage/methylation domain-containing protein [Desulfopila aestuarii]|uniref:General secretion pathway protein I n=1 Tax=Desulfopila aestuarii DSM 18488 TaxID=1121416 RepID=A0A1M7Y227_9BACT|nr:prepilin-type N-terminal cleavage/methylation domain-containing protein [Desulfopila aestuarii]SHO45685.1 general secretion pathway protein I [Desulfopila aestuarii DSM 18488]
MMKKHISSFNEKGFTLIEVLIAIIILAIGIIALAGMQGTSIKGNKHANSITTSSTWAADTVEQIFALDYDSLVTGNRTSSDGNNTIAWTVTSETPLPDTKSVLITVTNNNVAEYASVTISYIKAKYVH